MPDIEGLHEILRGLEGMTPREGGQPDAAQLRALLEKLRKQLGDGGMSMEARGPSGWLDLFGTEDGEAPAPRRFKVRVRRLGDGESQAEQIEQIEPKKRAPVRDDER